MVWVLRFWALWLCWLVGSSRTESAHPSWAVISSPAELEPGFPQGISLLLAAGTVGTLPPPPQLGEASALHEPKELFCLFSWEFSVQRFKSGSIGLGREGIVELFGCMGSCFHSPSWTIYVHAGFLSLWLVYLFVRQALLNGVPVNFSSNKSKK